MNRRMVLIISVVVLILVIIAGVTLLGSSNQTTQSELLPGSLEPSPTSDQVLDGEPPAVVPVD